LHHIPCRGRRIVKASALGVREVRSGGRIRTGRECYTVRVLIRTERIRVKTKVVGALRIAVKTKEKKQNIEYQYFIFEYIHRGQINDS